MIPRPVSLAVIRWVRSPDAASSPSGRGLGWAFRDWGRPKVGLKGICVEVQPRGAWPP